MTAIDIHHEANHETHPSDDDGAVHLPEEQARQIVAKARYEAFALVTEARGEAEAILDEARAEASGRIREAELHAESLVDAARIRADEIPGSDDRDDSERAELEAEHEELTERVSTLRSLARELEQRFDELTAQAEGQTVEPAMDSVQSNTVHAPSAAPVLDYSPAVQPLPKANAAEQDAVEDEKGSFYNRRSAKLPRIGDEGGRSALDMMRSIRGTLEDD